MKRRNFFKATGLCTTSLLLPGFLKSLEWQSNLALGKKRLIVVQLSGGNDGLNTIIPINNNIYYQLRPGIGIPKAETLNIDDTAAFNPAMKGMAKLLEKGWLTILNDVGYPNPDRSHFRSMDIWQTGSGSDQNWNTGWIGRLLDNQANQIHHSHFAIEVDQQLSLVMKGLNQSGFAVKNPKKLKQMVQSIELEQQNSPLAVTELDFLYKTLADTKSTAGYVADHAQKSKLQLTYPNNEVGKNLQMIASMILGGADTSIYYTSTSGFDTHVRQLGQHGRLLEQLSDSLWALTQELHQAQELKNTVILVFSEFGRRAKQNASGGTDHGTAGNVFLIGEGLKKTGLYNPVNNLTQLVNDDLVHQIDFRSIYATLIDDIFQVPHADILLQQFPKLRLL